MTKKLPHIKHYAKKFDISNSAKSLLRGFSPNERTRIFDSRIFQRHESVLNRLKSGLSLILHFDKI